MCSIGNEASGESGFTSAPRANLNSRRSGAALPVMALLEGLSDRAIVMLIISQSSVYEHSFSVLSESLRKRHIREFRDGLAAMLHLANDAGDA